MDILLRRIELLMQDQPMPRSVERIASGIEWLQKTEIELVRLEICLPIMRVLRPPYFSRLVEYRKEFERIRKSWAIFGTIPVSAVTLQTLTFHARAASQDVVGQATEQLPDYSTVIDHFTRMQNIAQACSGRILDRLSLTGQSLVSAWTASPDVPNANMSVTVSQSNVLMQDLFRVLKASLLVVDDIVVGLSEIEQAVCNEIAEAND